jgi:WD40 repeat protein
VTRIVHLLRDVGLGVVVARIFVSYATPDRAIADEVSGWLRSAGHQPFLDHDLRDGVRVGEAWKQRLYRELREVDAVIGVVTSSLVASHWCSTELGIADSRGCRLMPLQAQANVVHPLMQDLQYVDYHADPQQARARLLQAIQLLEDGGGPWREGDNPFPGLEPFTAALSPVFFGRRAEAREVGNRLRTMRSTGGMLAIVGPSGCGKSSLLNAAVGPSLGGDPAWLTVPALIPGSDPSPELARALATTANHLGLDWSANDVRGRLEAGTDGLRRLVDDLLAASPGTHQRLLLILVDQAEELFTRTTPAAQQRFAQLLHDAVAGPVRVVAAMRSEFLDDFRKLPALTGTPIEVYVLAPLDREMLRDVIEQPAKVARLRFENGLAAALVADTDSGEALPLLAFTLRQLADGLPAGGTLTWSHYDDLGGVQGALTRHADAALAEAVQTSNLTERDVLAGFTRLVTVDDTGRRSRRRTRLTGLAEPLRVALQVFVDHRLLLSDTDEDGQAWITVAHEALLTGWRPLDTAITDITAALRIARTVEQAAAEWNSADRPEHYLWDHERLTATLTTLGMTGGGSRSPAVRSIVELDEEARAFLDATARRARAIHERERRRRTHAIIVLSTLLVLALIAAGIAVWQQRQASEAQHTAIARGMIAEAGRVRNQDPRRALQLDVAARQFDGSPQTQADLQLTLTSASHFRTLRIHSPVYGVAFAPDGRTLATASTDRTVSLWDLNDRDRPRQLGSPLTGHTGAIDGVAFAPDGRTLATASADQTVRLWDLSDRDRPRPLGSPLIGHTNAVYNLAFAPDGRILATASADRTAILWDLSDRDRPRQLGSPLTGHTDSVIGVAFAPDGRTLATGGTDQTAILWDLSDRDRPRPLRSPLIGHTGPVFAVAFAQDGRTLATASADQTAILWDLSDRDRPRQLGSPLTGHTGSVYGVAFASDGRTLATGGTDQTAILWDLSDRDRPRPLRSPLIGHTGPVFAVAFAQDGRTLATASADQTVRLWDLSDRDRPRPLGQPLTGHTGSVIGVAFAPDGRILATGSADQTVRLWDLSDRDRPRPLGQPLIGHSSAIRGVAFAQDGGTLATASLDRTVRLWDLSDRDRPRPLGSPLLGHTGSVYGVAFAPDGRTLATVSTDQTAILWDLPRLEGFRGDEVREACLRAGASLDKATWGLYAPGISYQDTCIAH